jgi:hypothetical protein
MARGKDQPPRPQSPGNPTDKPARAKPRPGLPDKSSIVSVKTLVSPKGNRYRVIETNETDAYDPHAGGDKTPKE